MDVVDRPERILPSCVQRLVVRSVYALQLKLRKRRGGQGKAVRIAGWIEVMLPTQGKSDLEPRQHRPLVLAINGETARIHGSRGMERIVLYIHRRIAVEEILQPRLHQGSYVLGLVVVGDIVTPEVGAELQAVPSDSLGKIVHELVLRYVPALREGEVVGIQGVRGSLTHDVQRVRERRCGAVRHLRENRAVIA